MRLLALTILFLGISLSLVAQTTSTPQGTFTVDQIKGCAPFTINLSAPTCDGSVGCDVDYIGNNAFQSVLLASTFTYTTPGTYTIRLVRGAQIDQLQVTVVANTQPNVQITNCGGNRVSVSVLDTNYDQYVIDYGDGSGTFTIAGASSHQHSFASSGTKTINVRGRNLGALDNCNSVTQNVNVVNVLPTPVITRLEVLDNSSIRIEYNGQPNIQYRLQVGVNSATPSQQIKTLFNTTIDTIKNITPETNYYCFRIGAFDPCNNTTTFSNTICSADLELQILNNENRVTWTTGATGTILNQRLNRVTTSDNSSISTLTSSPHSDTDVNCGLEYCYQLTITYTNNSQSISLPKCGTAISTDIPDAIANISSVVSDNGVDLIWLTDPDFTPDEFSVFKIQNGTSSLLQKTAALQLTDPEFSVENPSCYKISYTDVCGNVSPESPEVCPIILSGSADKQNTITLNWSSYAGWANGVNNYVIEKYDQDGNLVATIDAGSATSYIDTSVDINNQVVIYVVRAIAVDAGITESISNRIVITKNPNLFHPTAFTPNADGLNDIFNVYGQFISNFEMDIFNRWGELMYTTTNLDEGWDGNYKGNAMPEGTYTFVAKIEDLAGRSFRRSGSVLLLRKN
jgi:gliding motility-associated-like protein